MATLNKKIVIVEDDEDFVFILEKKFTKEGFSVITSKDGEEGVTIVEKEKPDLVLSDMLMPKMDGIAMGKKIRETNTDVPIIFLTNIKKDIDPKELPNCDYIIKSETRIDDIVAKVKTTLGIS